MESDDQFAQWAARFISWYGDKASGRVGHPAPITAPITSGVQYCGITPAACELLRAVDAGGVPAFVTNNLKQIAKDNGIEVTIQWTPNEIVAAIRAKAGEQEASSARDTGLPPG